MKPETIALLAAVGVGAYFLMKQPTSTPIASFAVPGGSVVLSAPGGGTGAMLPMSSYPTSGLYGLGNRAKRPTIQPGVVPVRGHRTGQRKVGWNV